MHHIALILALGLVVMIIAQQLRGQRVRASRVIGLPLALTAFGLFTISRGTGHVTGVDEAFLVVDVLLAVGIGLWQGRLIDLQRRADGHSWLQMTRPGLWLWGALVATRVLVMLLAHAAGATFAASSAPLLLMLGLNRIGQGFVVGRRVLAAKAPAPSLSADR